MDLSRNTIKKLKQYYPELEEWSQINGWAIWTVAMFGKFAMVAKLLGSSWNLSQIVRPDLIHTPSVCQIEDRPSADLYGPQMGSLWGLHPYCCQLLCPSDSTVGIWLCISQTERLGILCNGSEGFHWIWSSDLTGTLNVSSPTVTPSLAEWCAQEDPPSESDE